MWHTFGCLISHLYIKMFQIIKKIHKIHTNKNILCFYLLHIIYYEK